MPAPDHDAKLRWEAGDLPVSTRFDDPYYSRTDGLAETRHVFLDGNGLEARFAGAAGDFHIAELGFGTGLNCLAAAQLWQAGTAGATLHYTGFERYPMAAAEIARALARWSELAPLVSALCRQWGAAEITLPGVRISLVTGDARETVPKWPGRADAWFLDGFAPTRNPEMWEAGLIAAVHARTRPGGTFATYSAAGHVRRALAAAGFEVARMPGHGTKREMLAGRRT